MKIKQPSIIALVLTILAAPFLCCTSFAQTNEIPIPNGNQVINNNTQGGSTSQPTVDAIVTNSDGTMTQEKLPYNPNNQTVIVNNNYGGNNASLFLPALEMGFMFFAGYWVGHNGSYWNGHGYVHVTNVNWNQHWNNYWHNTWKPKWNNYANEHRNDPNFKWGDHQNDWHDNAGNWHNRQGADEHRGNAEHSGGERGGGMREGGGERGGGGGHR